VKYFCNWCGRLEADEPAATWCRICVVLVECEQCLGARRAEPELGLCDLCRRRNALDVRKLYAAAESLAWLDLEHLEAAPVTYPHRVPLTGLEAARLARAARELRAAALELAAAPLLRDAVRKGPQRAERAPKPRTKERRPWAGSK
jgi:hypothetical protein